MLLKSISFVDGTRLKPCHKVDFCTKAPKGNGDIHAPRSYGSKDLRTESPHNAQYFLFIAFDVLARASIGGPQPDLLLTSPQSSFARVMIRGTSHRHSGNTQRSQHSNGTTAVLTSMLASRVHTSHVWTLTFLFPVTCQGRH